LENDYNKINSLLENLNEVILQNQAGLFSITSLVTFLVLNLYNLSSFLNLNDFSVDYLKNILNILNNFQKSLLDSEIIIKYELIKRLICENLILRET
jgi:hypothetical protein